MCYRSVKVYEDFVLKPLCNSFNESIVSFIALGMRIFSVPGILWCLNDDLGS